MRVTVYDFKAVASPGPRSHVLGTRPPCCEDTPAAPCPHRGCAGGQASPPRGGHPGSSASGPGQACRGRSASHRLAAARTTAELLLSSWPTDTVKEDRWLLLP